MHICNVHEHNIFYILIFMKGNTGLLKQENNEKVAYGECLGIVWKE